MRLASGERQHLEGDRAMDEGNLAILLKCSGLILRGVAGVLLAWVNANVKGYCDSNTTMIIPLGSPHPRKHTLPHQRIRSLAQLAVPHRSMTMCCDWDWE